ncbi:HEAT repeat domain-containing protein [Burkholderia ubonensis]|uniref:HEAT repeat domain-containing protein n=1 Tax=Burkholderia ubonensis TaxID=101571 RepID=UPI000A8AA245|nr:HEAT repeat domain-containing protein [Burkholderia ubonensis]
MSDSVALFSERFCADHIEEFVHLDRVRERALLLSDFTLGDFVRIDRRLLGHLRGLTLRTTVAWRCIRDCIDTQGVTSGVMFAAGVLAFAGGDQKRLEEYRAWLDGGVSLHPLMEKIARWIAPGWHRIGELRFVGEDNHFDVVWKLITAATPEEADAVIAVTPRNSAPEILIAIANAIRKFGLRRFITDITLLLEHRHREVRIAALMALLRLDGASALDWLWRFQWTDLDCPELFYRAMIVLPPSDVPAWIERLEDHGRHREALICIAFSGMPEMLSYLRDKIDDHQLSTLARLCHVAVAGYKPDEKTFDPKRMRVDDARVEFPPVDQPEAFFFNEGNHRYEADGPSAQIGGADLGSRVIAGQAMTVQHAISVLRGGIQLQRVIAGYWLENQGVGSYLDPAAPGFFQFQQLSALARRWA